MLGVDYRITNHFAIGVSGIYAHTWTAKASTQLW